MDGERALDSFFAGIHRHPWLAADDARAVFLRYARSKGLAAVIPAAPAPRAPRTHRSPKPEHGRNFPRAGVAECAVSLRQRPSLQGMSRRASPPARTTMQSCARRCGLALVNQQAGRHREALRLYTRALEIDPANVDATHMIGVVHYQLGEYGQAIGWIERAIVLRPDLPALRSNLLMAQFIARERSRDSGVSRLDRDDSTIRRQPLSRSGVTMRRVGGTDDHFDRHAHLQFPGPLVARLPRQRSCADLAALGALHRRRCLHACNDAIDTRRVREARFADPGRISSGDGGIAAASNAALGLATGKFVALIDHDDEIAPWALQTGRGGTCQEPRRGAAVQRRRQDRRTGHALSAVFQARMGSGSADGAKLHQPSECLSDGGHSIVGRIQAGLRRRAGLGSRAASERPQTRDVSFTCHACFVTGARSKAATARAMQSEAYPFRARRAVASHVARTGAQATIIRTVRRSLSAGGSE